MIVRITAHIDKQHVAAFIDGFNEWARNEDVETLFDTIDDEVTGGRESWYEIDISAA